MYDRRNTKQKWTIMKYIKDFDKMVLYADAVRKGMSDISDEALVDIQNNMQDLHIYKPRFNNKPNYVTIRNKVNQIVFYMFGYKLRKGSEYKIIMSPLGNLLLDNKDSKEYVKKIFFTMLYSMEFKHPFNKMSNEFKIHPYRVIFKLLLDERLEGKLYHDEVFYYVMYLKEINPDLYEKLVRDILEFRKKSPEEKYVLFKKDEWVVANALHEWNYATGMLQQAGIVIIKNDDNNQEHGILVHGNDGSGRRRYKLNYIVFNQDMLNFAKKMINNYPYYDDVIMGKEKYLQSESINQLYTFYPKELITELGLNGDEERKTFSILNITEEIDKYARNENNKTFDLFENILCDAFNLFSNVRANKIAKAGTTDIECIYYYDDENIKKFDVEAKARKIKLMEISAGRLRAHREQINSNYTIVVTPEYLPAVREDIKYTQTVLLLSGTLSNFLYQYSVKFGRNIDYKVIDDIIEGNQGTDITDKVNDYIYRYLGTNY